MTLRDDHFQSALTAATSAHCAKDEWVTPKISLMEAVDTLGKSINHYIEVGKGTASDPMGGPS